MTRQEKYPDTNFFKYCNANSKNRIGGDCVVRAISVLLNQEWKTTVRELTEIGLKKGYVLNDPHCYNEYLKQKGYTKMPQPKDKNNKKYTIQEWSERTLLTGVAHAGSGHLTVIKEGVTYDIWDCTGEKIGNYWIKEGEK